MPRMKRWDTQSFREAIILWTMARMISPKEFKVNLNLATALKLLKHEKESLEFLKVAEDNIPRGMEEVSTQLLNDWKKGNAVIVL